MCDEDIELREERRSLLREHVECPSSLANNNHQTTDLLLSERHNSLEKLNRGISKDCEIRYHHTAVAPAAVGVARDFQLYKRLREDMAFQDMSSSHRSVTFTIGVVYSVFALAAAAACLGYRYDVQNDHYGFRVLMEGTALLGTVTFLASLGLVFGVVESRRSFISAWLVLQIVVPLYTVVFYGWSIYESGIKDDFGPVRTAVPYIGIIAAIQIIVMIACTLTVNKYYIYLKIRDSIASKCGVSESP